MSSTKDQSVDVARRSARGLHHAGSGAEWAATRLDRVVDEVDRFDPGALSRAWTDARRPRRRNRRLVAALITGAIIAIVASRLWRHVGQRAPGSSSGRDTGARHEWHIDRDDGGWQIQDPRQTGPRSTHRTQAEAIAAAERSLADEGGGTVVVHALDGRPREERLVEPTPANGRRRA